MDKQNKQDDQRKQQEQQRQQPQEDTSAEQQTPLAERISETGMDQLEEKPIGLPTSMIRKINRVHPGARARLLLKCSIKPKQKKIPAGIFFVCDS